MEILLRKRLVQTFFILVLLFVPLIFHLAVIQLGKGDFYAIKALNQETHEVVLEDYPRGQILDRNMRPLTDSFEANRVVVFPAAIKEPALVANELAHILHDSPNRLMSLMSGGPRYLPYPISTKTASAVNMLDETGVMVLPVTFRYGSRPLAAQVVGHLGRVSSLEELPRLKEGTSKEYRLNDWVGRTGLEKIYEKELKATGGQSYARTLVDARGNWLSGAGIEVDTRGTDLGRKNVVTTIDFDIQKAVEDVLDERVKKGTVVVMEAASGDIVALASRPAYNPRPDQLDRYLIDSGEDTFVNHGTALYQPGSIFKLVIAAAALAEGIATPDTILTCDGGQDKLIKCWHQPGHGRITLSEAIAQSCNPAIAQLAQKLGSDKIIHYARAFGFENQNIIGYPEPFDKRQDLSLIAQPYNLINSSVGQGPVLATPVQITVMMNTLVNNGMYLSPRLVKEVRGEDKKASKVFHQYKKRRVISNNNAIQIKHMLEKVTTTGVGQEAYVPVLGSAGKTGSAQVGDDHNTVNAWFSGYAPLDNPRYVVTVLVRDGVSGGETAAPVFKEIMKKLLTQ